LNNDLHEIGQHLLAVDLIDASNYPEKRGFAGSASENNAISRAVAVAIGDPRRRLIFAGNTTRLYQSYNDGFSIATELDVAGYAWKGLTFQDASIAAIASGAAQRLYATPSQNAPAWAFVALADCTSADSICADPYAGKYLVGGFRTTGSDPCIWSAVDTAGTIGAVTQISRTGAQPIVHVAAGPVYKLAAGTTEMHVWADGAGALTSLGFSGGLPGGHTIKAITWASTLDRFVVLTGDGAGAIKAWTVTSGAAAIEVYSSSGFNWGGAIASRGSLVLASLQHTGTTRHLAISTDAGVSWDIIVDPLQNTGTGAADADSITLLDNRFAVFGYQGAGAYALALGLRTGPLR
jgi:hypothetical protein